jgi:hypothetical protein
VAVPLYDFDDFEPQPFWPDRFRPLSDKDASLVIVWAVNRSWSHARIERTFAAAPRSLDKAIHTLSLRLAVTGPEALAMTRSALDDQPGHTIKVRAMSLHGHLIRGWRGKIPWRNAGEK